jgi:beta-aspartyl-peptidase (threonine type)
MAPASADGAPISAEGKSGTVGAVALDSAGHLAAATSTGGMANKMWGRVGDSPVIGAGTYASALCAVSCTGWGEYFIRNAIAFDVHARMAYTGATLAEATHAVIFETLQKQVPGSGGMCALDAQGRVELCFNTPGMYRGWIGEDGEPHVGIFR